MILCASSYLTTIERRGSCEMEQQEVGPKGEGVGMTESNESYEHGYDGTGTDAFAREWGRAKIKTLQASLINFCFFSANPCRLGLFDLLAPAPSPSGLPSAVFLARPHGARLRLSGKFDSLCSPFQGCLRHSVSLGLAVVAFSPTAPALWAAKKR